MFGRLETITYRVAMEITYLRGWQIKKTFFEIKKYYCVLFTIFLGRIGNRIRFQPIPEMVDSSTFLRGHQGHHFTLIPVLIPIAKENVCEKNIFLDKKSVF